ncbi:MAG TPA: NAD synthetase, partial [Alphaproteobacteria bacterium]|nr:NAD synthetase [Alphaproteobacteria bacterium]
MEHATAGSSFAALAYLIAGVCFILALRGLSSPTSSQRGNRFGMIGMTIAVVTTLVTHVPIDQLLVTGATPAYDYTAILSRVDYVTMLEILAAIGIGAVIGITTARRIAMTAMPQLVAAFHSLVGLAAVLVACAAFLNPIAFGIADMVIPMIGQPFAVIHGVSRVEMGLGVAIGAITFSGSVIAFLKLNGNMGGKPILLPGRHAINLAVLAAILLLVAYFTQDRGQHGEVDGVAAGQQ